MSKKKQSYLERSKHDNQVNRKAIIWSVSVLAVLVILMTVLLIVGR